MYGVYCFCIPADQDIRMISTALPETFLCWRLLWRACRPSGLIVSEEGAGSHCEVALVGDSAVEDGGGSPLTDGGEW